MKQKPNTRYYRPPRRLRGHRSGSEGDHRAESKDGGVGEVSALSRMIAWVKKMKYQVSRECCYDEMEEKGYASQGRCCGLMGGDNWSDNTMYMCIDCPHYTPIIGGKHETAD